MAATLDQHIKQQGSARILQAQCRRALVDKALYHAGACDEGNHKPDARNLSHMTDDKERLPPSDAIEAEVVRFKTPDALASREVQVYSPPDDLQRTLMNDKDWITFGGKSPRQTTVRDWMNSLSAQPISLFSNTDYKPSHQYNGASTTVSHEYDMCVNPASVLKVANGQDRAVDMIMASPHSFQRAGHSKHVRREQVMSVVIDVDVKTNMKREKKNMKRAAAQGRASSFHDVGGLARMTTEPPPDTKVGKSTAEISAGGLTSWPLDSKRKDVHVV